jgi:glucan-binding YG repeat protein
MKPLKKIIALAAVVSIMGLTIPMEALAATKAISSVTIYVGLEELSSGENLPSESEFSTTDNTGNYVYTNNDKYQVNEVEWITSDSKEMTIGYEPKMRVTLYASDSDEYAFKGGYQSSNINVKGGTYVSASRSGSDTLYVTFKFKPIKGTYESPEEAYWRDNNSYGNARWSSVDNSSDAYDVTLYRGSSAVHKVQGLKATTFNFYPYMTKKGTYSFKVRTVPYTESEKKYGKASEWIESDEIYLPEEKVSDGSGQGAEGGSNPGATGQVGWIKSGNTWYYRYPDGSYHKNSWAKINNKWYLFDNSGAMLTGWQQRNNLWYFLTNDGAMVTGWALSNNKWYYMNPSTTSGVEGAMKTGWINYNNRWYYTNSSGAMLEGWQEVEGNWYYFYPGEGSKAVNTTISGFPVDGNGVWHK